MARPHRLLAAGLTYHVTARGNERRLVFRDDTDRRRLLAELARAVAELGWLVGTYCLMPNHLHLVVRTPEPDLSLGMRDVLGRYARAFNDRHDRTGHLFGGRFHTVVVTRDAHHAELYRYLALNPVRGHLCAAPTDFAWSAHTALLGLTASPPFLDTSLAPFAGDRERYAAFIAAAGPSYLHDLLADGTSERLRLASDAGFSQRETAAVLGVPQRTISRRLGG